MDSKCTYIIGFDICDNDPLRDAFVQKLKEELNAQRINQSCYKVNLDKTVSEMQDCLLSICKTCASEYGKFHESDFVKLYCSAYLADYHAVNKHEIYEYNINLLK